ncbi:Mitochondrial protein [Penicillium brevicompactum]|uniref:Mitochondrial protein n=1 Tax=Penicillium brevicompactum TaxID=5074 RepID=UPI0025416F73|nr:Mitochondrial protein [Penicillium brevicompactum]KAJ5349113.1 Mitochondrial protein [Penicillium brevicompactum]
MRKDHIKSLKKSTVVQGERAMTEFFGGSAEPKNSRPAPTRLCFILSTSSPTPSPHTLRMSFRPMLQQRAVAPIAATLLAGGIALYPKQTAFAEVPRDNRKPIYDDFPADLPEPSKPAAPVAAAVPAAPAAIEAPKLISAPAAQQAPSSPTPTDILTAQVRQARLFLYSHSLSAEQGFNKFLSKALNIENCFTNTVASLAPSPESGERLLPGGVYVVVAAMAGSIVSRNRGIFLRAASPSRSYEKKVPAVADQHLAVRERAEHIWLTGLAHSGMARQMMEEKIGDTRKKLEELVSKGH